MRLRHIVIALPLLLCATQITKPISLAEAAAMNATEATGLLAKSAAIDVKCSILAKDQSQTLKDLVARAEISLAEKASVSIARKTIAEGRGEGKAALCDPSAAKLVNEVLAAATAAVAAPIADTTSAVEPQPVAAAPIVAKPEPAVKAVAVVQPQRVSKKPVALAKLPKPKAKVVVVKVAKPVKIVKPVKGLGSYAAVAEKYYVATRCGTMSASSISRLYQTVLSNHQQAMANNRPVAVRAMLRAAEARAGNKSCS
jgi:hypothetical protein